MTEAPTFWSCEECEQSKLVPPTKTCRELKFKASAPTISNITEKATGVTESPNKKSFAGRFSFKEARVDKGKTKYISCEEAVKLSSGSNNPSRNALRPVPVPVSMQSPYERTPIKAPPHERTPIKSPPHERRPMKTPQHEKSTPLETEVLQHIVQQSTSSRGDCHAYSYL